MLLRNIQPMSKKCAICSEELEEQDGKLIGTMLKTIENKKNILIYVCNNCQKNQDWIERAKIRAA